MSSSLSVQIHLALRDRLTGPARQAGRSFQDMGRRMQTASASITAGANRSAGAVNRLGASATRTSSAIGRLATNMRNMRTMAGGFAGLGLGGGAGLIAAFPLAHMVKIAADYESKLVDIRKVWTGTQDDYDRTVAGLGKLHRQLPISRVEIAKTLEEGVRAGVAKTPEGLLEFTRAASAFGVAFSLPITEAAPKLAKMMSSLKLNATEFVGVADTMNTLANKLATNEGEMLEYVRRVGGLATSIGGKRGLNDVLAIGAAQMAAGTPKEVAAAGLRTLLARLGTQPKTTRDALKHLGFDPQQIKKQLPDNIFGTVFQIIDAIAKAPKKAQAGLLADLAGMKSFDAFARLLSNTGLMIEALKIVRGEFRLTIQSELIRRVSTLNSAFQITKNLLGDLSDSIVMAWRPQIQWALTKLQELSLAMKGSPILQWTAAIFAGLAGLSLVALPFGLLGASLFSALLGFRAVFSVLRVGMYAARPFIGIIQGIVHGLAFLGPALATVARTAGMAGLAIAGLRLALLTTGIGAALTAIVAFWPAIKSAASGFWEGLKTGWEGSEAQQALNWLLDTLPSLRGLLDELKAGFNYLMDLGSLDDSALKSFFDAGAAAAQRMLNPIQSIMSGLDYISSFRILGGSGGQNGALAGATAAAGNVGRFATLPGGLAMPPSIAPGPVTNNNQKTVNVGGISVTVNATTNASPDAIGAAAGGATGNALRGVLGDGGNQ